MAPLFLLVALSMGALCVGVVKDQALIEAARGEDLHRMAKLLVDRGCAVTDEVGEGGRGGEGGAEGDDAVVSLSLRSWA